MALTDTNMRGNYWLVIMKQLPGETALVAQFPIISINAGIINYFGRLTRSAGSTVYSGRVELFVDVWPD